MPFVHTQNAHIYYEFHPSPQKPVLLLSNSLGTQLSMWDPQLALQQHFSLLRYDARGHGQSSVPEGPYTIDQMGQDVVALLDLLNLQRIHFCGLSMGGMVGQWLGAHAASRIDRLILSNTAAKIGTADTWNERIATVQRQGMAAIVPTVLERWFTAEFRRRNPAAIEVTGAMLLAASPQGYTACCAAVRDMDQHGDLPRIQAPTLVLFGTEDGVTPPNAAHALAEGIRGSLTLALTAAHLANVEAAEAFNAAILNFLLS